MSSMCSPSQKVCQHCLFISNLCLLCSAGCHSIVLEGYSDFVRFHKHFVAVSCGLSVILVTFQDVL